MGIDHKDEKGDENNEPKADFIVKNLTPQELRASRLPDKTIIGASLNFKVESDVHYYGSFWPNLREEPPDKPKPILLLVYGHTTGKSLPTPPINESGFLEQGSEESNRFLGVETIVAQLTSGIMPCMPRGRPRYSGFDIRDVLYMSTMPTQRELADLVDAYKTQFSDAGIRLISYRQVPRSVYTYPGFSREKIEFERFYDLGLVWGPPDLGFLG